MLSSYPVFLSGVTEDSCQAFRLTPFGQPLSGCCALRPSLGFGCLANITPPDVVAETCFRQIRRRAPAIAGRELDNLGDSFIIYDGLLSLSNETTACAPASRSTLRAEGRNSAPVCPGRWHKGLFKPTDLSSSSIHLFPLQIFTLKHRPFGTRSLVSAFGGPHGAAHAGADPAGHDLLD